MTAEPSPSTKCNMAWRSGRVVINSGSSINSVKSSKQLVIVVVDPLHVCVYVQYF